MRNSVDYDVIVVGAGSAALTAAITARNERASVGVLEKSPRQARGGNCRFTGGSYRFWHKGLQDVLEFVEDVPEEEARSFILAEYSADTWYNKMLQVTEERADPRLTELLVTESTPTARWLKDQGVRFELATRHSVRQGDRIKLEAGANVMHARGGGEGLSDALFDIAGRKGVEVIYRTKAVKLLSNSRGGVNGVTVQDEEGFRDIKGRAVVLACGGFEANREWRAKYLGPGWDLARPRGTRYNTGDGLRMAFEVGAQPAGHWSGCHSCCIDYACSRMPEGEDIPIPITRNESALGIMVNADGVRFFDEGEDFRVYTYAKIGLRVLQQPQAAAWQIFDGKVTSRLDPDYSSASPVTANSVEDLAEQLRMPALTRTIEEFNAAVQEDVPLDRDILDGRGTVGITPGKSNWAQKIDQPPLVAYAVGCGITFTYGGIKINTRAQVLDTEGEPIPGLYATGEIVGGIWHKAYIGGGGIALGTVFGRIAGANAAGE
ncbi:MAG: FAD-dependent tricarballylate dehydrogenase TcuA [Chloroflexi bacterium]|nr:FAD-dependent tricarballylate dehydrogenase TcuA [Chloroflexota bacterium]